MPADNTLSLADAGKCREGPKEQRTLHSNCPNRDAALLLALLSCDALPLLSTWYQELDLAHGKGGYLPIDPRGARWTRTNSVADLSNKRAAGFMSLQSKCRARPMHVVKTIRMNGHLSAIINVSSATGLQAPIVLHLVREIKSVYLSRKEIIAPFGLPTRSSQRTLPNATNERTSVTSAHDRALLEKWAYAMCAATRHDIRVGLTRHGRFYETINFTNLVLYPHAVVNALYQRHFKRDVPAAVTDYINKHRPGRLIMPSEEKRRSWEYQFGTSARNLYSVQNAWKHKLKQWEIEAIEAGCNLKSWDDTAVSSHKAVNLHK